MNRDTLKKYEKYGKTLTENDRIRIEKILQANPEVEYADVLSYMLSANVKLEQECLV